MGRGESGPVALAPPAVTICPVFSEWGPFGAETGKATDSDVSASCDPGVPDVGTVHLPPPEGCSASHQSWKLEGMGPP